MKFEEALPRMRKGEKFYLGAFGSHFDNGNPHWFSIKDDSFTCSSGYEPEIKTHWILREDWFVFKETS